MIRRGAVGLTLMILLLPVAMYATASDTNPPHDGLFDAALLEGHIPQPMLGAYLDAAATWDLDWTLLAAIGKLECDHGRTRLPGCWPPGTVNHAGARGPMQFLGSTWRAAAGTRQLEVAGPPPPPGGGYGTDGDGDQIADPWSAYDAAHAAARYLVDLGGRDDPRTAAKHYNAGPSNPNPAAGEGYAARTTELMVDYHALAGSGGPGAPAPEPQPEPESEQAFRGSGGCALTDPTGTGGCVTPRTAHLVTRIRSRFGEVPMWCWAPRPGNPTSDHPRGRACDITYGAIGRFPTPVERDQGWETANWLVANAEPLGIAYVIWDGRIWTGAGWRAYTGGGIYNPKHPTGGHFDHVHVSVQS